MCSWCRSGSATRRREPTVLILDIHQCLDISGGTLLACGLQSANAFCGKKGIDDCFLDSFDCHLIDGVTQVISDPGKIRVDLRHAVGSTQRQKNITAGDLIWQGFNSWPDK